jgi:hypothetical protein
MSDVSLQGFAYGEELDAFGQRSLGYHLVAPAGAAPWRHEVEMLARRLQATPYPDSWPQADLFCSILLEDGRRVVAVARYGLVDHTPAQRRGGLELIGFVACGEPSVSAAQAIYRWLRIRRSETDDLHTLGGHFQLQEIALELPSEPATDAPVFPIRLWQDGALLFAAASPADPDCYLPWLESSPLDSWQWLPLVGRDFPLRQQTERGPLVAWMPYEPSTVPPRLIRSPARSSEDD